MRFLIAVIVLLPMLLFQSVAAQPPTPILFTTDTAWTTAAGDPMPFGYVVQILSAGSDTIIQPPNFTDNFGAPTGDDMLVITDTIGAGCPPIPPFYGIFNIGANVYSVPEPNQIGIGVYVYARVWHGNQLLEATLYTDSQIYRTTGGGETANLRSRESHNVAVHEPINPDRISTFSMSPAYPNPTNSSTVIRYNLPQASRVDITVFDALGRQVATLVQGNQSAAQHSYVWHMGNLASGVYFVRFRANGADLAQQRITLLR